ncbi:MAG: twin-arginine translocase subunit TatC [Ardenticatenales bacterium]
MTAATPSPLTAMPLMDHLRELRTRLMWSVGSVLVGMIIGLGFSKAVINGLISMCTACPEMIVVQPLEGFTTYFRVALMLGVCFATPMLVYQLVAFVMPALMPSERKWLYIFLPGAFVLFVCGLLFGYYIVFPRTINFLIKFLDGSAAASVTNGAMKIVARPQLSLYIAFFTNLLMIIGLTFETPLLVLLLAKLKIVTTKTLGRYRRHAIVIMAVAAAVLTPTPDPFTMLMVLVPMYLLYEMGILLARFA